MFSWCFLSVSRYFLALFDIWAENRIFLAENQIFQEILKKPQNMFSLCFLECFMGFLSIVRHLSREPNFWAENSVYKKIKGL